MHGNAAEWTGSFDGERRLVRGGSWRDLPKRSTSSFRITYAPWQRVFNVGFRVISEGPRTMAQR
jgi:formylglycine-generating enzyme required for sulfatase activity